LLADLRLNCDGLLTHYGSAFVNIKGYRSICTHSHVVPDSQRTNDYGPRTRAKAITYNNGARSRVTNRHIMQNNGVVSNFNIGTDYDPKTSMGQVQPLADSSLAIDIGAEKYNVQVLGHEREPLEAAQPEFVANVIE